MVAALTHTVLPALFIASGGFALATLVQTWRHYGARALAFRAQLAALDDMTNFTVKIATVDVREVTKVTRRNSVRRMDRPAVRLRPAQRAAA